MHSSPGTGKTLLAKAIGNEISKLTGKQVTFYYHKGSESFSKYVGKLAKLTTKIVTYRDDPPQEVLISPLININYLT